MRIIIQKFGGTSVAKPIIGKWQYKNNQFTKERFQAGCSFRWKAGRAIRNRYPDRVDAECV